MQLNFKTPAGTLINLYAEDAAMLSQQLQELEGLHSQVKIVEEVLGVGATASIQRQPQKQAPQGPSASGAPQCPHGERQLVKKPNYEAWFCCKPKGSPDKCNPIDAKTGREWT